jgi:ABC-2 type transport system permease protein/lipopolysaccharide transport system permease protein
VAGTRTAAVTAVEPPDEPPPELIHRSQIRLGQSVRDVWRARELVLTLSQRDFLVRYKQAELGVAWALVTPLVLVGIFTLVFKRVARVDVGDAPYVLFAYLGLLPWTFFSGALSQAAGTLLGNRALLNKVRFPREVFALSTLVVAGVDTAIAAVVLAGLFVVYGVVPAATSVWVPVLLVVQVLFTLAAALVASVAVVYLRDLRLTIPIVLQFGLFATPVAYGLDAVPKRLLPIYSVVNPLGPVIDGYRRTILFGQPPDATPFAIAAVSSTLMALGAYALFKRLESGIADVA